MVSRIGISQGLLQGIALEGPHRACPPSGWQPCVVAAAPLLSPAYQAIADRRTATAASPASATATVGFRVSSRR